MKPITKQFKKYKERLNNILITRGKIMVDNMEFQNIEYHGEPVYIDIEGFVFNNEYNRAVISNAFEGAFLVVRKEFEENLKLPQIDDHEKYLNDIIETYSHFENKIVEEDDGSFSADFIKFENCDPTIINAHIVCNYDHFLECLKHQFRDEILYLYRFIKPENILVSNDKSQEKLTTIDTSKFKSFEFVFPILKEKHCFKEFVTGLVEYRLIGETDKNKIRHTFSGTKIKEPVVWIGDKGALKYLIKQLRSKGIVKRNKAFWQTTSVCFKWEDEDMTSKNISTQNYPTKEASLEQLNLLIRLLVKGIDETKLKRERKI